MSALPEIDYRKVAQKLANNLNDLTVQIATLETLAETLRDQRDVLQQELNTLKATQQN